MSRMDANVERETQVFYSVYLTMKCKLPRALKTYLTSGEKVEVQEV